MLVFVDDEFPVQNLVNVLLSNLYIYLISWSYQMPIKMSKKGGGTKKRSFDEGVVDLKKQGKSEESARKIMGSIQKKQEGSSNTSKKKKKKKS